MIDLLDRRCIELIAQLQTFIPGCATMLMLNAISVFLVFPNLKEQYRLKLSRFFKIYSVATPVLAMTTFYVLGRVPYPGLVIGILVLLFGFFFFWGALASCVRIAYLQFKINFAP